MRSRFRRLFISLSILGYAFLGGGPSLWALGLDSPSPACAAMGCTCTMMRGGKACPICAAFARKFPQLASHGRPHSCEMRQRPLAPQESADSRRELPAQQVHTLPGAAFQLHLALARDHGQPAPSGLSFYPEPPTPIPD